MGGEIQGKLYARDEDELRRGGKPVTTSKSTHHARLVSSEDVFFAATGITDGELLKGVNTSAMAHAPTAWSCAD